MFGVPQMILNFIFTKAVFHIDSIFADDLWAEFVL